MFDTLSGRFDGIFRRLRSRGRLSETDVDEVAREIRLALLEADVNVRVVKAFVTRVKERATGAEVAQSLSPAQQVIKIVHEELTTTLGGEGGQLATPSSPPAVIVLAGLQGSGKTTVAAKLARHLDGQGRRPLLVAADLQRPAAIEQLRVLGERIGVPVSSSGTDPVEVAEAGRREAERLGRAVVIVDTAGRLQIDDELMGELARVTAAVRPDDTLLTLDAMTGQEAVAVASEFATRVPLTGVVLTKLDGDARGGAALSLRAVTACPIQFIGVGEKLTDLEVFYPDRMASRILGMGDVLTLIERAQEHVDEGQARNMERKLRAGQLNLTDFMEQLKQVKKMGPLEGLIGLLPGAGKIKNLAGALPTDDQLKEMEAIILSMTPAERDRPETINGSRRRRIARGSGTDIADVNRLLKGFQQMQQMMKQMGKGKRIRGLPIDPAQLLKG